MNVWDWIRDFEWQARAEDDSKRVRLTQFHPDAFQHRHTDPDLMMALLDEGRRLARSLGEPWWVLFFDHWRVETLIYYKEDYTGLLDLAVQTALDLRKPALDQHPLRFSIWCNLVAAYLCIDPRGYVTAIQQALDHLQQEVPAEGEEKYLLIARRHWFAYELGRLQEANDLALEELAIADADPDHWIALHHRVDTYKTLCRIAHRRDDWPALLDYATAGEELARSQGTKYRYELAAFVLSQALWSRHEGREEEAKRLCRRATAQMARLGKTGDGSYYDALCAYHELGGELERALRARDRELEEIQGKGQLAYECECRLKRCQLLRKMGLPLEKETALVRQAMTRLRDRTWYQEELERILIR
jgi:hypothetical protein